MGTFYRIALSSALVGLLSTLIEAAEFQGLGDLPSGEFSSRARDLSADGNVIVGSSVTANGTEAFLWTPQDGMVGLGQLDSPLGSMNTEARGVSSDGSVVIGSGTIRFGNDTVADLFRWTASGGMENLGFPDVLGRSSPVGVSGNGSMIAGSTSTQALFQIHEDAFLWTDQTGFDFLGEIPWTGLFRAHPTDFSRDGTTIVGTHSIDRESFLWREAKGFQPITNASPVVSNSATAVSADGSVITGGASRVDFFGDAFIWTADTGTVPISFNNRYDLHTYDISDDGKVAAGQMWEIATGFDLKPMVWDAFHGPRNLEELLINEFGLADAIAGWRLERAFLANADGSVIVGLGKNPAGHDEAWRVVLDPILEPTLIPGDANLDGVVDELDLKRVQDNMGIGAFWYQGNFDGIGRVGEADLQIVLANMIPEPSSVTHLALAAAIGVLAIHFNRNRPSGRTTC